MSGESGKGLRDRVVDATGVEQIADLEGQVDRLEVAFAENRELAASLDRVVGDVERAVAGLLERSAPRRMGT